MGIICNHIMGVVVLFFKSFSHQAFRIDFCVIPTLCSKHIVTHSCGSGSPPESRRKGSEVSGKAEGLAGEEVKARVGASAPME